MVGCTTHEKCQDQRVEDHYEQKFEEVCGIRSQTRHPIRANSECLISTSIYAK